MWTNDEEDDDQFFLILGKVHLVPDCMWGWIIAQKTIKEDVSIQNEPRDC